MISELTSNEVTAQATSDISRLMTLLAGSPRAISQTELRRVAEINHLFSLTVDGTIVGLVCLVPMRLPQGVRLWIESVIVDPAYRGKGHGRALMQAAVAKAASYGDVAISLTSNPTRSVAHRLFEQLGFKRAATSVFRRSAQDGSSTA
ncbi:GNAT family N-acetyltransferase [Phenylobacterium kunshanense]|uniref:GNAT family N-acetyltransferase n=1 Tax=Phenylobacterium kunshanense TaxID=1445034 RepID=A0A328BQZ2_9CAUL|nr:GNAT family N-acetyltransferase [Phenylobacterium kunshanense]